MRSKRLALLAAGLGLTLAVSACGANQESPQSNDDQDTGSSSTGDGVPVGVILPETASSARWEWSAWWERPAW